MRHAISGMLQDSATVSKLCRYNEDIGIPELIQTWAHIVLSPPDTPLSPLRPMSQLLPEHKFMITSGANQAFMNILFATCVPGDEVLLPLPYYFSHYSALELNSLLPVLIKPDPVSLLPTLSAVRSVITPRTRALVVTSPSNPSGVVYPASLLSDLSDLCAEHSILLITDEVYGDLAFTYPHRRAPSVPLGAHTVRIFSMSKSHGLPGFRVGALLYPERLHEVMAIVQDTLMTHTSTLSQIAALASLQAEPMPGIGSRGDLVLRTRLVFEDSLRPVYAGWKRLKERFRPELGGGYYIFLPYWDAESRGRDATADDDEVVVRLLMKNFDVLTMPGSVFGTCGFLRVSCVNVTSEDLQSAAIALSNGMQLVLKCNSILPSSTHI